MSCHYADTEPVNHKWQGHEKAASADEPLIGGQRLQPPDVISTFVAIYYLLNTCLCQSA